MTRYEKTWLMYTYSYYSMFYNYSTLRTLGTFSGELLADLFRPYNDVRLEIPLHSTVTNNYYTQCNSR